MKKHLEKNLLDLKYKDLLNWRTIIFACYFAIIGIIASYLHSLYSNSMTFFFSLILISFAVWEIIDEIKYSEIKRQLNSIEQKISKLE